MKSARVTVRLPSDLRRKLKAAGTQESDLLRTAVERQLAAEDEALTGFELAKDAGIIGIVAETTRDLSTNRKYFDGFGES
jgi:hypothetical protein